MISSGRNEVLVEASVTFDAHHYRSRRLVVFESLYYEDYLLTAHRDINDVDQSLDVTNPQLHTTLSDNTQKLVSPKTNNTVEDVIRYTDLIPGQTYSVRGKLVDQVTGQPVMKREVPVQATATFKPNMVNGTVTLTFVFDGTQYVGHNLVAFESLYYNGRILVEHADLNDASQTVSVNKKDVFIPVPGGGSTTVIENNNNNNNNGNSNNGNNSNNSGNNSSNNASSNAGNNGNNGNNGSNNGSNNSGNNGVSNNNGGNSNGGQTIINSNGANSGHSGSNNSGNNGSNNAANNAGNNSNGGSTLINSNSANSGRSANGNRGSSNNVLNRGSSNGANTANRDTSGVNRAGSKSVSRSTQASTRGNNRSMARSQAGNASRSASTNRTSANSASNNGNGQRAIGLIPAVSRMPKTPGQTMQASQARVQSQEIPSSRPVLPQTGNKDSLALQLIGASAMAGALGNSIYFVKRKQTTGEI